VERGEEEIDVYRGIDAGSFHPPAAHSALEGEEILERKKAWAELEREQADVKRNIKSLMRLEPGSRAIDDPALADRVSGVRLNPHTYETAQDIAIEKRMKEQTGAFGAERPSNNTSAKTPDKPA